MAGRSRSWFTRWLEGFDAIVLAGLATELDIAPRGPRADLAPRAPRR